MAVLLQREHRDGCRVLGTGFVPWACKNGWMGNNTLWLFCLVRRPPLPTLDG